MKLWIGIFALWLLLSGCSTRKNTALSRQWEAFSTRYNVYYNGNVHLEETLQDMERNYEPDYSRLLPMHPAEALADETMPRPAGDFKRTIEKMQKAIQLHSIKRRPAPGNGSPENREFRRRSEFNPFLHNAWLRLAQAQYYSGDFTGAAATFLYLRKNFWWLPEVTTEARLWEARCYCALGWNYEAEETLRLVDPDNLPSKSLRHLYDFVKADYLIHTGDYAAACPYLKLAADAASGAQRRRLLYLLGQLYSRQGMRQQAHEAFAKAGSGIGAPYELKLNARLRQSEAFMGTDLRKEIASLRSLTRYERNAPWLDRIFYAMGNLETQRGDTAAAIRDYRLAAERSERGGIDRGLPLLALGRIYFSRRDYVNAQPCYSDAIGLLPASYPGFDSIKARSDVLDELALYAGNVTLQDSLLRLSALDPAEQMKICIRLAKEATQRKRTLTEDEELEKRKAEASSLSVFGNAAGELDRAPSVFSMPGQDKSWYFYNDALRRAGQTEFRRRWGTRKLEDDWRRRNKTTFSFDDSGQSASDSLAADSSADSGRVVAEAAPDELSAEFYMRQIPQTEADREKCNHIILESLFGMGTVLKDKLSDYPAAEAAFTELLKRYPESQFTLDAYHNLYLMAAATGRDVRAEELRDDIVREYPSSPLARALEKPDHLSRLREMNRIQQQNYDEALTAYRKGDNATVHRLTRLMEDEYPLAEVLPRFVFIDALASLSDGNPDAFKEGIAKLLARWPESDLAEVAGGMMQGMNEGRRPLPGASNFTGLTRRINPVISSDSVAAPQMELPAFTADDASPQVLVLVYPADSVSGNDLLYDVARFNFTTFAVKEFELEQLRQGDLGMLVISGFNNRRQLLHYRKLAGAPGGLRLPTGVVPVMMSRADYELMLREGRSMNDYLRFLDTEAQKPPRIPGDQP